MDMNNFRFSTANLEENLISIGDSAFDADVENEVTYDPLPDYSDRFEVMQEEDTEPDIDIYLSPAEVIQHVNQLINHSPDLPKILVRNLPAALTSLQVSMEEAFGLMGVDLLEYYKENEEFKLFINLVGVGVIVGTNYIKSVPNDFKLVYFDEDPSKSLSVHNSSIGYLYKGLPIISFISKANFNSTFGQAYKQVKIPREFNGDYAAYFSKFFEDKPVFDRLDEIDVTFFSDMDIAELISNGNKFVMSAMTKLPKKRINNIMVLAKAMLGK